MEKEIDEQRIDLQFADGPEALEEDTNGTTDLQAMSSGRNKE